MAAITHDHHPLPDGLYRPPRDAARHLSLVPPRRRSGRPTAATFLRRRLLALILLTMLLVATVAAAGSVVATRRAAVGAEPAAARPSIAGAAAPSLVPGAASYVVQPGDSVWSIARRLKPAGDVRDLVDRIVAENGGAALRPGQVIALG